MAAGENRFAPDLNEKEAIELLEDFIILFIRTIIPLALVRYEMIIANSARRVSLAVYQLIANARSWNNC